MIHIERNQNIPENENIKVFSPTGDYEDLAMVEYCSSSEPDVVLGAFHAQFVKYGSLVYKLSDPRELGAEILKLDPDSTHSAASFVRMQNELMAQFNNQNLEPQSLEKVMEAEQIKMEEQAEPAEPAEGSQDPAAESPQEEPEQSVPPEPEPAASSTPPVLDSVPQSSDTQATSTAESASSTPIMGSILEEAASSTLDAILPEATSTQAIRGLKSIAKKITRKKLR